MDAETMGLILLAIASTPIAIYPRHAAMVILFPAMLFQAWRETRGE